MKLETMISYCGLTCSSCPIYLATREKDKSRQQSMREDIAEQCSKLYGMNMKPEDVTDCDGCRADTAIIFSGCLNCEIRKCAIIKNIESCVYCNEYACDILKKHFVSDPASQTKLEKLRQNIRL